MPTFRRERECQARGQEDVVGRTQLVKYYIIVEVTRGEAQSVNMLERHAPGLLATVRGNAIGRHFPPVGIISALQIASPPH
jgi:hypothetical protein